MRKAIRYELSVMVHKKEFLIALCIMMAFCILSFINTGKMMERAFFATDRSSTLSADYVFVGSCDSPLWGYLSYIFAFIVVLPYSLSFINDTETGILPVLLTRFSKKKYFLSKIIVCFIGNVIIIAVPFLVNYVLCRMTYTAPWNFGFASYGTRTMAGSVLGTDVAVNTQYTAMPFYKIFLSSPAIYSMLYIAINSAVSGVLGVFLLCLSFFIKRFRPILFLPVYLLIIGGNILNTYLYTEAINGRVSYVTTQLFEYLSAFGMYGQSPKLILGLVLVLIIFSVVAFYYIVSSDILIAGGGGRHGKAGKKNAS